MLFADDKGGMLNLSDALAGIAKAKPHLVKAPTTGGSGFTGGGANNVPNPFKDKNVTEMVRLKMTNPNLAEQLAAQATA